MRAATQRGAAVAGLSILLALTLPAAEQGRKNPAERLPDQSIIYCLTAERRGRLVEAAMLLGLSRPGSTPDRLLLRSGTVDVLNWPSSAPDSFRQTCDALRAADSSAAAAPASGLGARSIAPVLISGAAVAILTFILVEWRLVRDRRRATAERLRANGVQFRRSVRTYVSQQLSTVTSRPDAVACLTHHDDLRSEVAKALLDEPRSSTAARALAMLMDTTMLTALTTAKTRSSPEWTTTMRALTDWALHVEVAVERLARAVEKWPRRDLSTGSGTAVGR
ncbi:hypothetical protein AB0C07_14620 [Actinoplanes missouriensis]|uniref:hypothetical protein n=1 Tax=Actinoplanes missouriensis TaxID=1866 RepID=UPI0033F189A2